MFEPKPFFAPIAAVILLATPELSTRVAHGRFLQEPCWESLTCAAGGVKSLSVNSVRSKGLFFHPRHISPYLACAGEGQTDRAGHRAYGLALTATRAVAGYSGMGSLRFCRKLF
jgi:hypothetical protein